MRFRNSLAAVAVLGFACVPAAPLLTGRAGAAAPRASSDYEWFDPVIVVRRFLLDGFHREPDERAMQQAMIEAMVAALDDPYTVYVPPAAEDDFNKALRGTYVGIGAEVSLVEGHLTIVSPLEDSPALEAGVRAGDVVLEIEGESTFDRPVNESLELLLGEPGTPVTLRVQHLDGSEEELTVTRRRIVARTVKGLRRIGERWDHWLDEPRSLAYLRIAQFNHETVDELRAALTSLSDEGLAGLVLDLRGNPGGELSMAIGVADLFLREGMIVSVRGRERRAQSWHAESEGSFDGFPMVVMVNDSSASAAEIVAGALQDNGRARVLGARTYGKGSVQELRELPYEQGLLKLTTGHYYLPGGRSLARTDDSPEWGVDPDDGFVVTMSDEAFADVIRARQRYEVIRPAERPESRFADPQWIRDALGDVQLAAALEAVRGRVDEGRWPTVGEDDPGRLAIHRRIERHLRLQRRLREQLEAVEQGLRDLDELAEAAGEPPLLPPGRDPRGGRLELRDAEGDLIAAFRVAGGDVEAALRWLRLEPIDDGGR